MRASASRVAAARTRSSGKKSAAIIATHFQFSTDTEVAKTMIINALFARVRFPFGAGPRQDANRRCRHVVRGGARAFESRRGRGHARIVLRVPHLHLSMAARYTAPLARRRRHVEYGSIDRAARGADRTGDESRSGHQRRRLSAFSTATLSGRTPRHSQNASAACSTSIPSPSLTCAAPDARDQSRNVLAASP